MKNKKKIVVAVILVILLTILGVGVLYFTTDFLKTEQQLFYKYLSQLEVMDSNFITQYNNVNEKIAKNSNSSTANMNITVVTPNQETGAENVQKILTVSSNGLENKLLKQSYRDFDFSSNGQSFLKFKYIKDNNVYGIIADNIVSKYLTVQNSNLKELFYNLGIEDTTAIPDSIPVNYEEILKIDEETEKQLKQTYGMLIYNNISKEKFYKFTNNDKTETIGLSLTDKDVRELTKLLLETVKNDTLFLNLIINKAQQLNCQVLNIENIKLGIQNVIDDIVNEEIAEEKELLNISIIKREKKFIKLVFDIYRKDYPDGYVPTAFDVSIMEKDKIDIKSTFEFDFSENNKIILSLKENESELFKSQINYLFDNNVITSNIDFEVKEDEVLTNSIKIQYQISNYQTENITQKIVATVTSNQEEKMQIDLINNIILKQDVQISKLTTENSAKLNDMSKEELNNLLIALGNRIGELYGEGILGLYSMYPVTGNNY